MVTSSVTVANLTQDILACFLQHKGIRHHSRRDETSALTLAPFASESVTLPSATVHLTLSKKECEVHFDAKLHSKAWQVVRTAYSIPWRIYVLKVCGHVMLLPPTLKYISLVKVSSNNLKVVIIPKRDMSTFLSTIADDVPLSSVLLPGASDITIWDTVLKLLARYP